MFSFKHPHQTIKINMDIPTIEIAISTKIYNSIKLLRATSNLRNLKSANSSIIIQKMACSGTGERGRLLGQYIEPWISGLGHGWGGGGAIGQEAVGRIQDPAVIFLRWQFQRKKKRRGDASSVRLEYHWTFLSCSFCFNIHCSLRCNPTHQVSIRCDRSGPSSAPLPCWTNQTTQR